MEQPASFNYRKRHQLSKRALFIAALFYILPILLIFASGSAFARTGSGLWITAVAARGPAGIHFDGNNISGTASNEKK